MMNFLLCFLTFVIMVISTLILMKYLNKFMYHLIIETNDTGLETIAATNVNNSFLVVRICSALIVLFYIIVIYITGVNDMNYTPWIILISCFLFVCYRIEIGACRLLEQIYNLKFRFSRLRKYEWEKVYLLGSTRIYKGNFWIIWEPLKKKIKIKR